MDIEERTDGLYLLGRKLDAYKIPNSSVLQVDLRLTSGDCPEGRVGDAVLECPGDCQNTYLAFLFSGDELISIGELAKGNKSYVNIDVAARYGAHDLIDVKRLLRRPDLRSHRIQHGRGIEVLIDEHILLTHFDKCTFYHVGSGLEQVYAAELACVLSSLDRIRAYARHEWPPEVGRARQGMN